MLEGIYNFNCTCSLCTAPDAKRQTSDKRRDSIIAIRRVLAEPDTTLEKALGLTSELLTLAEDEGLDIKLKDYYNELMNVFYKLKDYDSALEFAEAALKKAKELGKVEGDEIQAAIEANVKMLKKVQERKKLEKEAEEGVD